jgi:hypothetical protein
MRATVRVHRPAQRQVRQAKGKRENRYVIKVMVMSVKRKGGQFLRSARTRGCTGSFNWAVIKLIYF